MYCGEGVAVENGVGSNPKKNEELLEPQR
jgi:hypothetical protein